MDRNKEYLRIGWKWKSGGEGEGERDGESDAIERWLVNERRGVERRGEERTEEGSLSLSLSLSDAWPETSRCSTKLQPGSV